MAGELQPLSDNFAIVDTDGRPTIYFTQWAQERQIDITAAVTADEALAIVAAYIAAHPIQWGDILGTLSAQTDLQAALDARLIVLDDSANWAPGAVRVDAGVIAFTQGDNSVTASITFFGGNLADITAAGWELDLKGNVGGTYFGTLSAAMRHRFRRYGTITGIEFDVPPYVNNDVIFYAGNLAFGTGLSYVAGVLTATASGGVLPVVDGSIPPVFLQNPDGSLIYAPI